MAILTSMKGVGLTTALTLLTGLPEMGTLTKKQIAALVGVAPLTKESGVKKGHAAIGYGRATVRKVVYMAALVASRFNPVMKAFYQRLCAKGKQKKVALIAVARKMIITLNAMIKTKGMWNPEGVSAPLTAL